MMYIETERLIIREFIVSDNIGLFELNSDPEVLTYLHQEPFKTLQQSDEQIAFIQQQYAQHGIGRWAVIEKASGKFIGWSGLKFIAEPTNGLPPYYDVGYRFIKRAWGKGYATESALAAIRYGFDVLKADVIYGACDVNNLQSARVLERIGLTYLHNFDLDGITHKWFKIEPHPNPSPVERGF